MYDKLKKTNKNYRNKINELLGINLINMKYRASNNKNSTED